MKTRWLTVPLLLATGCGSERQFEATAPTEAPITEARLTAPTSTTAIVVATTISISISTSTTLGPVTQPVSIEATLPVFDHPATLWRVPAMPPDPERLARWARVFGFTDDEIGSASGGRIARDTPDGQVLSISEPGGRWAFVNGPAGMFAEPGSCPLPVPVPASTLGSETTINMPPDQSCTEPPPPGVPDPTAAEEQARALWDALGIDVTGTAVAVGGDEYLREVTASDDVGSVTAARLRVVIGGDRQVVRAIGSLDAPVAAGSVPRIGLADALDRFARQPISSGPATTAPASFDGVYRVTGATEGLMSSGGSWLIPTYEVSLADGRTLTLLAIEHADIPID